MSIREISRVCGCGRGYRSRHDLLCGYCRGKQGRRKLDQYHQALEAAQRRLQLEYFRHYVHPVSSHGCIKVETV